MSFLSSLSSRLASSLFGTPTHGFRPISPPSSPDLGTTRKRAHSEDLDLNSLTLDPNWSSFSSEASSPASSLATPSPRAEKLKQSITTSKSTPSLCDRTCLSTASVFSSTLSPQTDITASTPPPAKRLKRTEDALLSHSLGVRWAPPVGARTSGKPLPLVVSAPIVAPVSVESNNESDPLTYYISPKEFVTLAFGAMLRSNDPRAPGDFDVRMKAVEDFLRPLHSEEGALLGRAAWIAIAPDPSKPRHTVDLKMIISKVPYFSEALNETSFVHTFPGYKKGSPHYKITVFESLDASGDTDDDSPLLELRVCKQFGELVWLGAGDGLTGTQVVKQFFEPVLNPFLCDVPLFIYDDAKKIIVPAEETEDNKDVAVYLSTGAIGSGVSYYEKLFGAEFVDTEGKRLWTAHEEAGLSIDSLGQRDRRPREVIAAEAIERKKELLIQNATTADTDRLVPIHQSPLERKKALENVQLITISAFYTGHLKKHLIEARKIVAIVKRVFNEHPAECQKTLKDLESAVSRLARGTAPDSQEQQDQLEVQRLVFYPYQTAGKKNVSEIERRLWDGLTVLDKTRLLVRPSRKWSPPT